ncbi:hypothetical protein JTB14_037612, partial [Gonioctena quinquepunctata]
TLTYKTNFLNFFISIILLYLLMMNL